MTIDLYPGTADPSRPPLASDMTAADEEAAIRCIGLTKRYGPNSGVFGLDLTVARGDVFGFLGPNGAGKTTAIRLLLNLIRPDAGRAVVLGLDCLAEAAAVHRLTGYLPGEFSL